MGGTKMNRLFRRRKNTKNTYGNGITISLTGAEEIMDKLSELPDNGKKAIEQAARDLGKSALDIVKKGIQKHYGVDDEAIDETKKRRRYGRTTIRVNGVDADGLTLTYSGRTLTPTHFDMSPSKPDPKGRQKKYSVIPGQIRGAKTIETEGKGIGSFVRQPVPYQINVTVIKGRRRAIGGNAYLANANGGVTLPFQRKGKSRDSYEAVRTLSVPQMIDNLAHDTIQRDLDEAWEKCLNDRLEKALKKV